MSDPLRRYLDQLHSLLSSDALQRGVDANNTVLDLSSFCLENDSEREQGKFELISRGDRMIDTYEYFWSFFDCLLIRLGKISAEPQT